MASPPTARRLPCALDAGGPLLNVKPANIELRPVSRYMPGAGPDALDVTARAAVEDGRLREDEGRNFNLLLDMTRFHQGC